MIGSLGIPRDSKRGIIGSLGIPRDSQKGNNGLPARDSYRDSEKESLRIPTKTDLLGFSIGRGIPRDSKKRKKEVFLMDLYLWRLRDP